MENRQRFLASNGNLPGEYPATVVLMRREQLGTKQARSSKANEEYPPRPRNLQDAQRPWLAELEYLPALISCEISVVVASAF